MIYVTIAKGFTVQWQKPPAGELSPRVQSLGVAQFVENKKIPGVQRGSGVFSIGR